jgi:hypothetical protein
MRTYSELVTDFATKNRLGKQKMIDDLSIEELKILRDGFAPSMSNGKGTWIEYIDLTISLKIEEERDRKLKELGIC